MSENTDSALTYTLSGLLKKMFIAAAESRAADWELVREHVEQELYKLADAFAWLLSLKRQDKITEEQARHYLFLQREGAIRWLSTVVSMEEAERLTKVALEAVRRDVEAALEWRLF